jgi:hypothetical protein
MLASAGLSRVRLTEPLWCPAASSAPSPSARTVRQVTAGSATVTVLFLSSLVSHTTWISSEVANANNASSSCAQAVMVSSTSSLFRIRAVATSSQVTRSWPPFPSSMNNAVRSPRAEARHRELVRNAQLTCVPSGLSEPPRSKESPVAPEPPATSSTLSTPSPEAITRPSGVTCSWSTLWSSVATTWDSQPVPGRLRHSRSDRSSYAAMIRLLPSVVTARTWLVSSSRTPSRSASVRSAFSRFALSRLAFRSELPANRAPRRSAPRSRAWSARSPDQSRSARAPPASCSRVRLLPPR